MLNEVQRLLKRAFRTETIARVSCACLDFAARRFTWEAFPDCDLCGASGELLGNGKLHECPACQDDFPELFYTDYDGNLVEAVEISAGGLL